MMNSGDDDGDSEKCDDSAHGRAGDDAQCKISHIYNWSIFGVQLVCD